jgi:hypothetical protein
MSVMEAIGFHTMFGMKRWITEQENMEEREGQGDRDGQENQESQKVQKNQRNQEIQGSQASQGGQESQGNKKNQEEKWEKAVPLKEEGGRNKRRTEEKRQKKPFRKNRPLFSKLSRSSYGKNDLKRMISSNNVQLPELCTAVCTCLETHSEFLSSALKKTCDFLEHRCEHDTSIDVGILVLTAEKLSVSECQRIIPLRNRFIEAVINHFMLHTWKFQLWSVVSIVSTMQRCQLRYPCVSHRLIELFKHRKLICSSWERLMLYQLIKKDLKT